MPPTTTQFQSLVLQELNLSNDTTAVGLVPIYWLMYDDKPSDSVTYFWVKKRLICYKMSLISGIVDISTAFDEFKASQYFQAWAKMMAAVDKEILSVDPGAFSGNLNSSCPTSSYPDSFQETLEVVEYYWSYFAFPYAYP